MQINKIYCENCLDTMRRMPENFIDLTVTSPPYDNLRKYNGFRFDFEPIAKELYRATKKGGVVVWVVGDQTVNGSESGTSFKQALYFKEIGFNLHDTMIYQKINYVPLTHNRYEQAFEFMFVFSKGKPKTFNAIMESCRTQANQNFSKKGYPDKTQNGAYRRRDEFIQTKEMKIKGNIRWYPVGANKTGHVAPFPEKLAEDHIISWSNENDLVYDPFTGSGTTAKMCILNSRNFIGSEISKEYCGITEERINKTYEKLFVG